MNLWLDENNEPSGVIYTDLVFSPRKFCFNIKATPAGEVKYFNILAPSVRPLLIGIPPCTKLEFILLPPLPILLTIYGSLPVSCKNSWKLPVNPALPSNAPIALIAEVLNEPPNKLLSWSLIFNLSLLTFG